jgi:cytochrome c oxidase subunit 3
MLTKKTHSFHIVDYRPWPILAALASIILTYGLVEWFHFKSFISPFIGLIILIIIATQWWRDITRERTIQGLHTYEVLKNLKYGMILFIVSEIFFFISFFWAFFHRRLSPTIEIGILWPPSGIESFNPFNVPLLNTIILISSGVTVTWTHHSIINSNISQRFNRLLITIILGIYFTSLQALEYYEAPFSIADSIYGSTFFVATGFHGLHVIIGTAFLIVCLFRIKTGHFSISHHFGFEARAWYWHFVDVVWLFLFLNIYWWSNFIFNTKSIFDLQSKNPIGK